eukprot:scaffold10595_cov238-Chaetoceros_neogracile.AAC.2
MGFVTGGRVCGLAGWQSAAVDGDQRTGSDELAPGVMGNSKCSDACTVWEKVGRLEGNWGAGCENSVFLHA